MALKLDVRVQVEEVKKQLHGVMDRAVNAAASRAINITLVTVRKEADQEIRGKHYKLPSKVVKQSLRIQKETRRNLVGEVVALSRPISLRHFNARLKYKKVPVGVGESGRKKVHKAQRQIITTRITPGKGPRTFNRGAFIRKPVKGPIKNKPIFRRTSPDRGPIASQKLPGFPRMFLKREIVRAMDKKAAERWPIEFQHELNHELRKVAQRARR